MFKKKIKQFISPENIMPMYPIGLFLSSPYLIETTFKKSDTFSGFFYKTMSLILIWPISVPYYFYHNYKESKFLQN